MKSAYIDDDGKEGRYFPSETEMPILVNYLQMYFSHPERSLQRSQVVQNVVSVLAPSNKHWCHRTVRLWFNNNKRVFYHPPNQQNQVTQPERKEIPQNLPPKKTIPPQPPRSLSVVQFPPRFEHPNRMFDERAQAIPRMAPSPIPMQMNPLMVPQQQQMQQQNSFSNIIFQEREALMSVADDNTAAFLDSAARITKKLVKMNDQRYDEFVTAQNLRNIIRDPSSAPSMTDIIDTSSNIYKPVDIQESYPIIESGTFISNIPAIISYSDEDGSQQLYFNGQKTAVEFNAPVSSIAFDEDRQEIYTYSCGAIKTFKLNDLKQSKLFSAGMHSSLSSSMCFWDHSLALATGSCVVCWSKESLDGEGVPQFTTCLTSYLSSISSLIACNDYLVCGSTEHHTPHLFASNGTIVARPIGHVGGITSLANFDQFCFLSGSSDQTARLWDVRTDTAVQTLARHLGIITALTGKDEKIATGGIDGVVKIWDIRMGKVLFTAKIGNSAPVQMSMDDKCVYTITSEKCLDQFYDVEKYGVSRVDQSNFPTNAFIKINLI